MAGPARADGRPAGHAPAALPGGGPQPGGAQCGIRSNAQPGGRTPTLTLHCMDDYLKREFESARLKHILFKARLRSFLYGVGSNEMPVRDADVCPLGQWIQAVALPRFGHLPETAQLDAAHRRLHLLANQLMDLHQSGHQEEAMRGLRQTNPLTEEVLQLLSTLERKLRKEAGA
jgi:Chemoreceptor zinc-binding domain